MVDRRGGRTTVYLAWWRGIGFDVKDKVADILVSSVNMGDLNLTH
jgi:hypothetical protein